MNLLQALKAVAPAVGDGRIVPQHAYIMGDATGAYIRAVKGEMSVEAPVDDPMVSFCVPYTALMRAMERDDVRLTKTADDNGLIAQSGRSRVTLRCIDTDTFPPSMAWTPQNESVNVSDDFVSALGAMMPFTAAGDGHIWQMGVHFRADMAFAFGPFAAIWTTRDLFPYDLTVPPWAAEFILKQDDAPRTFSDGTSSFRMNWANGTTMTSSRLIEEAPDGAYSFIENLSQSGGVMVPSDLFDIVTRIKSYGVKRISLSAGKITYVDDRIEIVEEVDIDLDGPGTMTYGVDQMLNALKYAETIDFSNARAVWHGNGYHGAFSGMSG